jgi:glucokinase
MKGVKGDPKKRMCMLPQQIAKASEVKIYFDNLKTVFSQLEVTVVFATMSFAGPVSQDHVVMTNWQCEARERVIHFTQLPFDLFPLDRRRFMNDLEAASYGIISKYRIGSISAFFDKILSESDAPKVPEPISLEGSSLVLSVGSGFGASFVCMKDASDSNCVVSSEAGHGQAILCATTDPKYETEFEFVKFVSQKLHGGSHQPEWEDLCACRGLELAFQFIRERNKRPLDENRPSYDEIRTLAENGDEEAVLAFTIHYRFILRAAHTLALGIQCQRVFLISSSQVKNERVMKKVEGHLKEAFMQDSKRSWFKNISVYVGIKESKFALSGGLFLSTVLAKAAQRESHEGTS